MRRGGSLGSQSPPQTPISPHSSPSANPALGPRGGFGCRAQAWGCARAAAVPAAPHPAPGAATAKRPPRRPPRRAISSSQTPGSGHGATFALPVNERGPGLLPVPRGWARAGLPGPGTGCGGHAASPRGSRSGQTAAIVVVPWTAQVSLVRVSLVPVSPAQVLAAPSPVCGTEGPCHRGGVPGALPHPDGPVPCHRRPVRPRAPHPARRAVTRSGRGCHHHRGTVTTRPPHGTRTARGSVQMSPTSCSALSCCPRRDGQTCRGGRWGRCSRRLPCPVL